MSRSAVDLASLQRSRRQALVALLLAATRASSCAGAAAELPGLVEAAPVDALPAAAALHRLSGTVFRGMQRVDGVSPQVLADLDAARTLAMFRHLTLVAALGRIGSALDDARVTWLVMKGPVVASLLYPTPGERVYTDLDLLVERRDFGPAVGVLEELGYQHVIRNWALAEEMLAGQIQMTSPSASIDLHWHLHYSSDDRRPFALRPAEMIERSRMVSTSGLRVPTFDPVDTLLTLAFHAARSDGHRLMWLKDVERALAVEAPDLDELVRRCEAYRCGPPVGLVLGRAQRLLGARVPDDVVGLLTPPALRRAEAAVLALSPPVQLHDRPTLAREFTRSVRSSATTTVAALPRRAVRTIRRGLIPPQLNETDDAIEKVAYLEAVASAAD